METITIFIERKYSGTGTRYCVETKIDGSELDARRQNLGVSLASAVQDIRARLDAKEKEARTNQSMP